MDLLVKPSAAADLPATIRMDAEPRFGAATDFSVRFILTSGYSGRCVDSALTLLRGVKVSSHAGGGRRLAWLHTESDCDRQTWADLGREFASRGQTDLLITTGLHARDAGLGAREAGVFLGDVVVCTDEATACRLLLQKIVPGDCVLLHHVDEVIGTTLRHASEMKWSHAAKAA